MENKIKTLFIADGEESEGLVKFFKESGGYKVVGHGNEGESVIEGVTRLKPDFLIMEVLLSGKDGFKVLDELKKVMGEDMPKVIFLSSISHSGFVSKAIKEGASYFMVKPVRPDVLMERLNDLQDEEEPEKSDKGLDERISNIFISIGIPAHIKGYQFLREAVKLAVEEPEIIGSITKKLYPTIAEKFETSSSKVERGMRHAIEVAWNRGKIENINTLFGLKIYSSNEKPTNGELIALIADKMIMEG